MNNRIQHIHLFILAISEFAFSLTANSQQPIIDTLHSVGLQEIVVSALRVPLKENSIPYSISVLESPLNSQGLSLSEDLRSLPGLEVNTRYNFAVGDRITNRGFGARTQFGVRGIKIIYDDMPVTFADGQSNLEMIDIQNLGIIEQIRGPGSSIYGNSSGGVLILHSLPVTENKFLASGSSSVGSNGLIRWNLLTEGHLKKTAFSIGFSDFHYDGFREHAAAQYQRALIKSVTRFSEKDNLQIQAGYVQFAAENPGSLTLTEADQNPSGANPSSISNAAAQNGNQMQLAATWNHKFDTLTSLKITGYGIHRNVTNPIIGKIILLPQYSAGTVAAFNSNLHLGRNIIEWSAGFELSSRFNSRKNYLNNNGSAGTLTINQDEVVLGSALFLQALLSVSSKLHLDACLRYDLNYFSVQNNLVSPVSSAGRLMNALDPSIGFIYNLAHQLNLFANISTSFETPTSTELVNRPDGTGGFNPDLNPAHAVQYEAGLRGFINQLLKYDVAFYSIHTSDELVPFQVPSNPGQDYYRNAGSTVHRGSEFSIRFLPVNYLEFTSSFTYIDAFYKNFIVRGIDYSGNLIPGISKFHVLTGLKLSATSGLYTSFNAEYFSKMQVDDANSANSEPHIICDLVLGHNGSLTGHNKSIEILLSAGISNVLNVHYISTVTVNAAAARYYEPGPGRTFYINFRFDFGIPSNTHN